MTVSDQQELRGGVSRRRAIPTDLGELGWGEEHDRAEERARRRRRIMLGIFVVFLAFLAYYIWDGWIRQPSPLPLASTGLEVPAGPDVWPLPHGDLGGTRNTTAEVLLHGEAAWTATLGSAPATELTTDGTYVTTSLRDGRIVVLDAATGALVWEVQLPNPLFDAPAIAGGRVFIGENSGRIAAYDAANGDLLWAKQVRTLVATTPLIANGLAYVYGQTGLVGIDVETGEELFVFDTGSRWVFTTPAIEGDALVLGAGDRVNVFDLITGERLYWYDFTRAKPSAVGIIDGVAYGSSTRVGAAFSIEERRPWWEGMRRAWAQFAIWGMAPIPPPPPREWVSDRPPFVDGLAIGDDATYFAGTEGRVDKISHDDGELVWRVRMAEMVSPPTLVPSGLLLAESDRLVVLDTEGGTVLDERPVDGLVAVTVVEGTTYIGTRAGEVVALR